MEVLSFQQTHLVLLLQLAKRMIYSVNFLFYSSTDYEFMLLNIPSEEMFALTLVVRKKKNNDGSTLKTGNSISVAKQVKKGFLDLLTHLLIGLYIFNDIAGRRDKYTKAKIYCWTCIIFELTNSVLFHKLSSSSTCMISSRVLWNLGNVLQKSWNRRIYNF